MLYSVKGTSRLKAPGQIESWDNLIIQATPAFRWAIGMGLEQFTIKSRAKGFYVTVLKDQTARSKSLGTVREDPVPSDSELAQRLGVQ